MLLLRRNTFTGIGSQHTFWICTGVSKLVIVTDSHSQFTTYDSCENWKRVSFFDYFLPEYSLCYENVPVRETFVTKIIRTRMCFCHQITLTHSASIKMELSVTICSCIEAPNLTLSSFERERGREREREK